MAKFNFLAKGGGVFFCGKSVMISETALFSLPQTFFPASVCSMLDVCIVIDSSGSIRDNNPSDGSYDNWSLMLNFVKEVHASPVTPDLSL